MSAPLSTRQAMETTRLAVASSRQQAVDSGLHDPVVFVVAPNSVFAANILRGNAPSHVKDPLREAKAAGAEFWFFCLSKSEAAYLVRRLSDQIRMLKSPVVYCIGDDITLGGKR